MEVAQPIPKRRGRAPVKAFDHETFRAVVRLRAKLAESSFAGLRPPSVSQVCEMVARDTCRSPSTVRGRYYANPLRADCEALDPQGAQLLANGALAPLDEIAAALPSVSVMGWRMAPSFMRAICHRLETGGKCKAAPMFFDDLPPAAQWGIAKACYDGWPEVLLIGGGDALLLMADTFNSLNVEWLQIDPPADLVEAGPIILTPQASVPPILLAR